MMLMQVERSVLEPHGTAHALGGSLSVLVDAVLVALVAWPVTEPAGMTLLARVFPPLALVGLLRLMPQLFDRRTARWLHDRGSIAVILALAALGGLATAATQIGALALIAGGLMQPVIGARRRKSTED
jgi:hypothetical protein